jgi:hypothetical protein
MTWGLFVLICVFVIAFIILCYLNFDNFGYFMETYFIFILLIAFIIILFVIDFNNQIQITTYVNVTKEFSTPLAYQTAFHSDNDITDIINVSFVGLYGTSGSTATETATNTSVNFNMDTLAAPVTLYANNDTDPMTQVPLFIITKTGSNNLTVNTATNNIPIDGYITLTLLCTGNQSIESSFKRID